MATLLQHRLLCCLSLQGTISATLIITYIYVNVIVSLLLCRTTHSICFIQLIYKIVNFTQHGKEMHGVRWWEL